MARILINTLASRPPQADGGTIYLSHIVPELARLAPYNEYFLLTTRGNRQLFSSPSSYREVLIPEALHVPWLRPPLENVLVPLIVKRFGIDLYFAPHNVLPLIPLGIPRVLVIQNVLYFYPGAYAEYLGQHLWQKLFLRIQAGFNSSQIPRSARWATRVIAPSESAKRTIATNTGVSPDKITVAYHGVNAGFTGAPGRNESMDPSSLGPYILCVSGLAPYKGIAKLIKAYAVLKKRSGLPHKLLIVGAERRFYGGVIKQLIEASGLAQEVILQGPVPHDQLPPVYRGSDLVALFSEAESFGLPVLEAMACGVPVVTSNQAALVEITGGAGVVVDPNDPEATAVAMESVLIDTHKREQMIRKGYDRAAEFTWECAARTVLQAFDLALQ